MKLKIEKTEAGAVRLTLAANPSMKPLVIEGTQLDLLLAVVDQARRAEQFSFEMEVRR